MMEQLHRLGQLWPLTTWSLQIARVIEQWGVSSVLALKTHKMGFLRKVHKILWDFLRAYGRNHVLL